MEFRGHHTHLLGQEKPDPLNHSASFAYDAAGRQTSTTDRDGRRRDFTYDNDNRLTLEAWVASGSTVNLLTYSYDNNANRLTAANYSGAYTMTYDARDRVATIQEPFGLSLTYSYDGANNRTVVQDSLNGVTTFVFDAANRLTSEQFGGIGQTPLRIDQTLTARDQISVYLGSDLFSSI
jgi:YD repeat-containing protein